MPILIPKPDQQAAFFQPLLQPGEQIQIAGEGTPRRFRVPRSQSHPAQAQAVQNV